MRVLVVTNMYPRAGDPQRGIFVQEQVGALRRLGLKVEVLHLDTPRHTWRYLSGPLEVALRALGGRVDVVHAHYGLTGAVCIGYRLAPVVVTYHGSDLHLPSHRVLSRLAGRFAAARIVVSRPMVDLLGQPADVIPCGVDPDRFFPRDRAEARRALGWGDEAVVLFPGAPDNPVKNYALCRAAVARMAKRPRLVPLQGFSRDEVALAMSAADLLLMTSHTEGAPLVVKEALACGLPVVSVPVGDVPEVLAGLPVGGVVPRDPAALAAAADAVLRSGARLPPMDPAAPWTLDGVARRVAEVYRRVTR